MVMGCGMDTSGSGWGYVVGVFAGDDKFLRTFILGNFLIGRLIMSLSGKFVGCVLALLYSLFRFL
jgi:hypothetical protein